MRKGIGLNQYNYVLGKKIDEKKEFFQAGKTKVTAKGRTAGGVALDRVRSPGLQQADRAKSE